MSNIDLQHIDLDNPEFQDAWSVLTHTNRSVFLTGKAGTGKSTFLKYIRENIKKKTVVLAPTGIAAVSSTKTAAKRYDLGGRKLNGNASNGKLQRGIYIRNLYLTRTAP